MAQPIQYTPQFIQTDVGAIQDKLNARQGQYDTAYASTLGAEDQFGQYDVHAKDIDLKNKVIGGFKDRVKSLVEQYGGDYAAASKQLVKEIVNTKNDKFFKLATTRNKLAEEQRRIIQQYGPNAIVMKDVLKPDLMDADGNYIKSEDLQTEVLNREQFKEMANKEYGYLAKDVQEGKFGQSEIAGLLKRQIRTGITAQQVPETASNIFNLLKKQRPDLPDDVAKSIAIEEARSYIGDIKHDYQGDPGYTKPDNTNPNPLNNTASLITPETYGKGIIGESGVNEYNTIVGVFNSAANDIPALKNKIKNAKAHIYDKPSAGSDMSNKIVDLKFPNTNSDVYNRRIREIYNMEGQLKKARENYVNSEKDIAKKYPIYNDVKERSGGDSAKAWKAVQNKINETNAVYPAGLAFRENANTINNIKKEYEAVPGSMMVINPETGKETNSKQTFLDIIKDKSISKAGIFPGSGKIFVEVDGIKYTLPVSSTKNSILRNMQTDYEKVKDIYSGTEGIGLFKLTKGSDGKYNAKKWTNETADITDGDGLYIRTGYKDGRIVSKITKVSGGVGYDSDLGGYTDSYGNQIAKELASKVELEPIKIRP